MTDSVKPRTRHRERELDGSPDRTRGPPLSPLVAGARRLPLLSVQTSIAARDLFAEAVANASLCSRLLNMFEIFLNRMYGRLASFVCL